MYVRGYLQGSENGRVATIECGRGMMKVRNQPKLRRVPHKYDFVDVVFNILRKCTFFCVALDKKCILILIFKSVGINVWIISSMFH